MLDVNRGMAVNPSYEIARPIIRIVREQGVTGLLRTLARTAYRQPGRATLILVTFALTPIAVLLALAGFRFIRSGNLLWRIGHLAFELDIYVKSGLLGWRPKIRGILLAPTGSVVNPCLLDYWRRYITIISSPLLVKLLRPLEKNPLLHRTLSRTNVGTGVTGLFPGIFIIQRKYETEFDGRPLLTLRESDRERGWRCLRDLGVPQGAWFVCLHVREGGYLPQLNYHSYRDADINTYGPAMQAIVERGGWVIRVGNPTMKVMPPMDQVIDYAHSQIRSDWMDVFCMAACQFLLGSDSGPVCVSFAFGVPCALTNYIPMAAAPSSGRDLWIPKLYWSVREDRYLTFAEVLRSPLRRLGSTQDFTDRGVSWVDNSPEEIRDITVEMMDRLDGSPCYSEEDERLQGRFKTLVEADPGFGTNARMGRDMLRKYGWLLDE